MCVCVYLWVDMRERVSLQRIYAYTVQNKYTICVNKVECLSPSFRSNVYISIYASTATICCHAFNIYLILPSQLITNTTTFTTTARINAIPNPCHHFHLTSPPPPANADTYTAKNKNKRLFKSIIVLLPKAK